MKITSSSFLAILTTTLLVGGACAVERPQPSIEYRIKNADLVVVVDNVQPLPKIGKEFDKFYRVEARVAGVLKGDAKVGNRIEVVVNNTIAELRNDCCDSGKTYVLFLAKDEGKYSFVGSPLGAIPVNLLGPTQAGAEH